MSSKNDDVKIVMIFDFPRKQYEKLLQSDMHSEDILDTIHDLARRDEPVDVWDFVQGNPADEISKIYDELISKELREKIEKWIIERSWDNESRSDRSQAKVQHNP